MDMMQSGTWFSLSQYALLLVLSIASSLIICFALHLLWLLKKQRNFECSPSLLVYLASLLLCCLALFVQYGILLLFQLLPSSLPQISPTQLIFWSGLFPGSLIPATPISVLFLSLDRLLIVLLPSVYMRKMTKFGLAAASSVAIFGLFSLNFGVNLAQRPVKEVAECISFGCLTSDASRLIYAVNRLVVALPNFLIGSAFLFVLFAYRRRMEKNAGPAQANNVNRSRKMGDRLALWVVIFEFGLDLLPNLANFVLTSFNINISVYVGAFRSLSYSFCAICSAFAHTAVLWRIFATKAPNAKSIIQTGAMTKAQFRSGEDGERSKRFSEQTQTRSFGGGRSINSGKQMAVIEGSRRNRITFENQ